MLRSLRPHALPAAEPPSGSTSLRTSNPEVSRRSRPHHLRHRAHPVTRRRRCQRGAVGSSGSGRTETQAAKEVGPWGRLPAERGKLDRHSETSRDSALSWGRLSQIDHSLSMFGSSIVIIIMTIIVVVVVAIMTSIATIISGP